MEHPYAAFVGRVEKPARYLGGEYQKPDDAVRIAHEMRVDEIPTEIKSVITRAVRLTKPVEA